MGRIRYTQGPGRWGQLISQRNSDTGQSHYYGFDAMGHTRFLADNSGSVTDSYSYKAFGEPVSSTGSTANPLRCGGEVGYYRDKIDRIYVRARHYGPSSGRWLSRDPLRSTIGDLNVNRYSLNAPVNSMDPSGMDAGGWRGILSTLFGEHFAGLGVSAASCLNATALIGATWFKPWQHPCNQTYCHCMACCTLAKHAGRPCALVMQAIEDAVFYRDAGTSYRRWVSCGDGIAFVSYDCHTACLQKYKFPVVPPTACCKPGNVQCITCQKHCNDIISGNVKLPPLGGT